MISYRDIEATFFDFVKLATGLPDNQIHRAYQNGSSASGLNRSALVSYNILNQTTIGIDSAHYANDGSDLDETVYGDRNITISVKTYDKDADSIIERIALTLHTAQANILFNQNGLGYLRTGSISDISSVQNGRFENRRNLDIFFHIVADNGTNAVNAITSAEISGAFYGSETITTETEVAK